MREHESLRLVTWNIENGGERRIDAIAEVLSSCRANVVALQEVTTPQILVELADRLGMMHDLGEANDGFHVAWLSGVPIERSVNHRLPTLAKSLLQIDISWNGDPVSLFATHLASRHDLQSPRDEIAAIMAIMASAAGDMHLLAGDFNALAADDPVGCPPDGMSHRGDALPGAPRETIGALLRAGYVDCFRSLQPTAPGFTYTAQSPWLRIDYVFASPHLTARLSQCRVVRGPNTIGASDHLPLAVDFEASA